MATIQLPSFQSHVLNANTNFFDPVWASYFQELHARVGTGSATATEDTAGPVLMAAHVEAPVLTVIPAPASYSQVWGGEVVALLEEVRDRMGELMAALELAGVMNDA